MSKFIVSKVTRNKLHALFSYLNRSSQEFSLLDINTENIGSSYTTINVLGELEELLYSVDVSEEYVYIEHGSFSNLKLDMSDYNLVYEYVDENESRILLESKECDDCYDKFYVCLWDYQIDVANNVSYLADVKLLRQYFGIGCDNYECD